MRLENALQMFQYDYLRNIRIWNNYYVQKNNIKQRRTTFRPIQLPEHLKKKFLNQKDVAYKDLIFTK